MHFVHFSCFAVPSHTAVYLSTPHSHGQCQAELVVDRTMECKEHEDESPELVMTNEGQRLDERDQARSVYILILMR